jgi:hypothetical protein
MWPMCVKIAHGFFPRTWRIAEDLDCRFDTIAF